MNLCSYFFQGLKCKFGRNCFNAHEISDKGFEINFCKLYLQRKCKTRICQYEHLSITKLKKRYHSQLSDLLKNCCACSAEKNQLKFSMTRPHSSTAEDFNQDLRTRIRGHCDSFEIKDEPFNISPSEKDQRNEDMDLRQSLKMRNKENHLDLRQTLSKSTMRKRLGSYHNEEGEGHNIHFQTGMFRILKILPCK